MQCEVCCEVLHKYKCPRCGLKTCSLACVKVHKSKNECTGLRDKTAFVKVKEFTESNLQSDYMYLEDVDRLANNACRDTIQKNQGKPNYSVSLRSTVGWVDSPIAPLVKIKLNKLRMQAKKRGINLRIMPYPLSKRRTNSTHYNHRIQQIIWLTEWNFPTAEATYKHKFEENTLLSEALAKFIDEEASDAVIRQKLHDYTHSDAQKIHILMKVENRPADSVRYYSLNKAASIKVNLMDKVIVEFPTFIVALEKHMDKYDILEQGEKSSTKCQGEGDFKNQTDSSDVVSSDNFIHKPQAIYPDYKKQEHPFKTTTTSEENATISDKSNDKKEIKDHASSSQGVDKNSSSLFS